MSEPSPPLNDDESERGGTPGTRGPRRRREIARALRKQARQDAVAPVMEDSLENDEQQSNSWPALPLKKGGEPMDLTWARHWTKYLTILLEEHPYHFSALVDLLNDKSDNIERNILKDLKKWCYLDKKYSPLPDVRSVMNAALRVVDGGFCIVDPIELRDDNDIATVKETEERLKEIRKKGLDNLMKELRRE